VSVIGGTPGEHSIRALANGLRVALVTLRSFASRAEITGDGNKRTAFGMGVLVLELNGHRFTAAEEDATQAVLGLAAGNSDDASFARWLRANISRSRH